MGVEMRVFIDERNSSRVGIDELRSVRASITVEGSVTFSSAVRSGISIVGMSMSTLYMHRKLALALILIQRERLALESGR